MLFFLPNWLHIWPMDAKIGMALLWPRLMFQMDRSRLGGIVLGDSYRPGFTPPLYRLILPR